MAEHSKIEWTDNTFNPWWGCQKVSPACDHCYAETFSKRTGNAVWSKDAPRRFFGDMHWAEPLTWNKKAERDGVARKVFCGSMCDVLEDRRDLDEHRARLIGLIRQTPALRWLLLTKRPQNYSRLFRGVALPANVWAGTTLENRDCIWRLDTLREVPASVRFLSVEPLLEDLGQIDLTGIHWVIVGGESGPGARLMLTGWAESILDQCRAQGVAFFMKQMGGVRDKLGGIDDLPCELRVREFPKEAAIALCSDCPSAGYPTDKTRCDDCPRREADHA